METASERVETMDSTKRSTKLTRQCDEKINFLVHGHPEIFLQEGQCFSQTNKKIKNAIIRINFYSNLELNFSVLLC